MPRQDNDKAQVREAKIQIILTKYPDHAVELERHLQSILNLDKLDEEAKRFVNEKNLKGQSLEGKDSDKVIAHVPNHTQDDIMKMSKSELENYIKNAVENFTHNNQPDKLNNLLLNQELNNDQHRKAFVGQMLFKNVFKNDQRAELDCMLRMKVKADKQPDYNCFNDNN